MSADRTRPPNLLVLLADQHAAHAMSCAGAEHLATPALDRLAASGTRFTRAYTTFPLCVPSRASMLTGRHPHTLGVHGNTATADEPARGPGSLGHVLRGLGYRTGYAGKWHALQPSAGPEDGFEVVAPFGDRGLALAAAAWLRERAGSGTPFALVVSFDDPHTICEYARRQPMPYGGTGPMPPPRDLPPVRGNAGPVPYEPEALRHEQRRAAASYGTAAYGPDDWRRYRYVYARLVERTDSAVGAVLEALEDAGVSDDTVVVYTSDHGDGDGSHGWNQKTALYEETCRVPFLVRDPRRAHQVTVSDQLVSVGLDLLPTLRSLAGAPGSRPGVKPSLAGMPSGDGLDLGPVLGGEQVRRRVVVETTFEGPVGSGTVGRAVVSDRHKYVVWSWGAHREQLFDLVHDPGETRNLAEESAFDDVLEDMRAALLQWCVRTRDERFLKRLVLPAAAPQDLRDEVFAVPY